MLPQKMTPVPERRTKPNTPSKKGMKRSIRLPKISVALWMEIRSKAVPGIGIIPATMFRLEVKFPDRLNRFRVTPDVRSLFKSGLGS